MSLRGDNSYRDYHGRMLVTEGVPGSEPSNLPALLKQARDFHELSDFAFEVYDGSGYMCIDGMADYLIMFDSRPDLFKWIQFDDYAAIHFAMKWHSLSDYLYGTTELFWVIPFFNNISDPTEMTRDYLKKYGIWALKQEGLDILEYVKVLYKRINVQNGTNILFEVVS